MNSKDCTESFLDEAKDFLIKVECPSIENVCRKEFYDILFNRHELKDDLLAWLFSKINSRFKSVYDEKNSEVSLKEIATCIGVCRSTDEIILDKGADFEFIINFWRKIFEFVIFCEDCDSFFEKETYSNNNMKYSSYIKNLSEESIESMDYLVSLIFEEKKNAKECTEPIAIINYENKLAIIEKRLQNAYAYNKKKFMCTLKEYTEAGVDFNFLIDGTSPKDGLESTTTSIVDLEKIKTIGTLASSLKQNYFHLVNFSMDVIKEINLTGDTLRGFSELDGSNVSACESLSGDLLYNINQINYLCSSMNSFKNVTECKLSLNKSNSFLDSGILNDLLKIVDCPCNVDCGHQSDIMEYPNFR